MTTTTNPHADAERHYDAEFAAQEADEREQEEAERLAPLIVFQDLQKLKEPKDWFKPGLIAGSYESADDIACHAIESDDRCHDLLAELMISDAAREFHQALADWRGKKLARAVMLERAKPEGEL